MKTPAEKNTPAPAAPFLERIALDAPRHIGSPLSLILHSVFFVGIFALQWIGFGFDQIMLILTTVVSLEAIYLSIFIQMTVNHQVHKLAKVSEDVEEISEDVEDISEDVEEMSKDIDDIQEDVKEISEDVEEISEDVEGLGEEIEKDDQEYTADRTHDTQKIEHIQSALEELLREIKTIKKEE
ncbi:MAG: hypothetical protein WAV46_00615 [Candidatus Moraniibacteriota bacterium]